MEFFLVTVEQSFFNRFYPDRVFRTLEDAKRYADEDADREVYACNLDSGAIEHVYRKWKSDAQRQRQQRERERDYEEGN